MQPTTEELIQEIKNRIVSGVHPEKIIIFGSHAYGTPTKDSDLDLCIILQTRDEKRVRFKIRKMLSDINVPKDILVFTPQHVEKYNDAPSEYLIPTILKKGKVIYINDTSEPISWFNKLIGFCRTN